MPQGAGVKCEECERGQQGHCMFFLTPEERNLMSTNLFVTQAANSLSTFLPFRLAAILMYSFTDFRALYNRAIADWGHSQVLHALSH